MKRLFGLAAGVIALSGCSHSAPQDILVMTNPPGANCALTRDGVLIGRVNPTPATVMVKNNNHDITISCSLSGYQDQTYLDHAGVGSLVRTGGGDSWGEVRPGPGVSQYESPITLTLVALFPEPKAARMPGASLGDLANEGDANIILRFQTLERLYDEGLITRDEYNRRRGTNLGALLRYSVTASSSNLDRPAPKPEQVVDRLRYLAAAYEEKSITAREQMAERTVILDALLPAVAQTRADPPPPITDPMQAAAVVGRLERLVLAKVINSNEQDKEKAAVFRALQVSQANAEAAANAAAGLAMSFSSPPTGPGVWLGSYASENQARLAWASLQLTHASELTGLQSSIKRVAQRHRPASYHLNAGTVANRKAAEALCKVLRGRHQFCRPIVIGK